MTDREDYEDRSCRVCGCTEYAAFLDPETGRPCHWVEDDLCSACVGKVPPPRPIGGGVPLLGCSTIALTLAVSGELRP